jgi:N-carbamoyl-L-amino-acid hydrolase
MTTAAAAALTHPNGVLHVDSERLWQRLMMLARIGATPKGGVCRLTLCDLEGQSRELFMQWARELGCSVRTDAIGNLFARREGADPTLPAVATGSHIDTQPTGGRFDGNCGVLAGLEVLQALAAIGYAGSTPAAVTDGAPRFGAYFEAHIEQGPVLEASGRPIGVVTGALGQRWYDVVVTGQEAHAGPTPMGLRRDALQGATVLMQQVDAIARAEAPHARGTVGYVSLFPNSRNTIPGRVTFTVDFRHTDEAGLARMETALKGSIAALARERPGIEIGIEQVVHFPPAPFDPALIERVRAAAAAHGLDHEDIVSGAGHDAVYVARVAPTAMIFVPCKDGISHNEIEDARPEHLAAGGQVLFDAMLASAGRAA